METSAIYDALRDGSVEVGLVFSTDGRIAAFDFLLLEDDQRFFPSYLLMSSERGHWTSTQSLLTT